MNCTDSQFLSVNLEIVIFKLLFQTLTYCSDLFVNDNSTKFSNCIMQKLVVNGTSKLCIFVSKDIPRGTELRQIAFRFVLIIIRKSISTCISINNSIKCAYKLRLRYIKQQHSRLKLCLDTTVFHEKKLAIVQQSMIYVKDFLFVDWLIYYGHIHCIILHICFFVDMIIGTPGLSSRKDVRENFLLSSINN